MPAPLFLGAAGVLAFALLAPVPARAGDDPGPGPRSFRLIAYDYTQVLADTVSYETYTINLEEQIGAARERFAPDRPTLAFLPEDAGLLAWFVGPRGEAGRQAAERGDSAAAAVAALAPAYAPQMSFYEAKCPGIPPARALVLALTDTAWRAFAEPLADLASRWGVWILASLNAPDVTVTRDPAKVALLADPSRASAGYAYEGGCEVWNTAFLFPPDAALDPDGAADPARVLAGRQKKVYLVPIERTQDVGLALSSESPAAARAIVTPFARLGVLTSKDAWMADVVERLEIDGMEVFLQPEAGAWAGHADEGLPVWPPDAMARAVWAMVQWQPETAWGALSNLTGNVGDLYFDGTATVTRDARAGEVPSAPFLGRLPQPGIVVRAPWVFEDPPPGIPPADLGARRASLDADGARLAPGSGDPVENGQLAGFVVADVELPPRAEPGPRVARRFGPSVAVAGGDGAQWSPSLAWDEGVLHLAWTDLRGGFESPYVSSSRDGGATWSQPVRAGDSRARPFDQQDNQYDARIAAAGGTLSLVWADFRNQSWDVYGARSSDGGATWSASTRVDRSPSSGEGFPDENLDQDPAVVALPDGRVVAAWSDARGFRVDRGIRVAVSDDGGRTWEGDVEADGSGSVEADQWSPALAVGPEGEVVLAWQDHRTGWNQVFAAASTDGGRTFGPPVRVAPSRVDQWQPAVAVSRVGRGPRVAVAFSAGEGAGGRRVMVALLPLAAMTGEAAGARVRTAADPTWVPGVAQARPAVAFAGSRLLVAWQDDRAGDWDVLLAVLEGGVAGAPVRVDDAPDGAHGRLPALAVVDGSVVVAWEDTRDGLEAIRVARARLAYL